MKNIEKYKEKASVVNVEKVMDTVCLDCGYQWKRVKTPPGKCKICQGRRWENISESEGVKENDERGSEDAVRKCGIY